jgi:hypothetical protein
MESVSARQSQLGQRIDREWRDDTSVVENPLKLCRPLWHPTSAQVRIPAKVRNAKKRKLIRRRRTQQLDGLRRRRVAASQGMH